MEPDALAQLVAALAGDGRPGTLDAVLAALREELEVEPPPGLRARILASVRADEPPPLRRPA